MTLPGAEGLTYLRSGATSIRFYFDPAEQRAELERRSGAPTLYESTWLAREAASVYAEVLGSRRQRERQAEHERRQAQRGIDR